MFIIFIKRYVKTPIFALALLSAITIYFLYMQLDLNFSENLKTGVYLANNSVVENNFADKLINKSSYFKYKKYEDLGNMKNDIKNGKITYGFSVDLTKKDKPFTLYGSDRKFSEIAKEDFYSTYFGIISYDYTRKMLNLSDDKYVKIYEKELPRTFKFEYDISETGKIFPIREVMSFLLYVLSLLVCYDYLNLESKSEFFSTFKGRKLKNMFLFESILVNAVIYAMLLIMTGIFTPVYFFVYNITLYLSSCIIIELFNKKDYLYFMPIIIMLAMLSIFISKFESAKFSFIFLNNVYIATYANNIIPIITYMFVLVIVYLLIGKLKKYRI